jgi:hypothetical protein
VAAFVTLSSKAFPKIGPCVAAITLVCAAGRSCAKSFATPRNRLLAVVNYGHTQAQCYAELPFRDLPRRVMLRDFLSDARYERDGAELAAEGLYLDMPSWGHHAFAVESPS